MMKFWYQRWSATALLGEVDAVAATLEARHGFHAADIAEFFSILHASRGNLSRSYAWAEVAEAVREKIDERVWS